MDRLPEGFPLHLFSDPRAGEGSILVLGAELEKLQIAPVNDRGGRAIAVHRKRGQRPETRCGDKADTRLLRVVAEFDRLPFRDGSAAEIAVPGNRVPWNEIERALAPDGRIFHLMERSDVPLPEGGTGSGDALPSPRGSEPPARRTFVVWPLHGSTLLVTGSPVPDPWPFASIHLGKPSGLLAAVYRRLSRWAPRRVPGRMTLVVKGGSEARTLVEEKGELTEASELALLVKAGRNAILLAEAGGGRIGRDAAARAAAPPGPATCSPRTQRSRASGARGRVVKFPLSPMISERTRRGVEALERVRETHGPDVTDYVPRILGADFDAPQPWSCERMLPGRAATRGWWIPGHYRRVAERALDFVLRLHMERLDRRRLTGRFLADRLAPPLQGIATACRDTLGLPFPAEPLLEVLRLALEDREVPLVRSHGDTWLANLLLDDDGAIAGVLDWDQSRESGWPLHDVIHLLAFRHRRVLSRWFAGLLCWRFLPRRFARWERRLLDRYLSALDLEPTLWVPLVVVYWVEFLALRVRAYEGRALHAAWMERNAVKAAPRMLRALRRESGAARGLRPSG